MNSRENFSQGQNNVKILCCRILRKKTNFLLILAIFRAAHFMVGLGISNFWDCDPLA